MAEVLTALFEAKETISDAILKARTATSDFESEINDLNRSFGQISMSIDGAEEEYNSIKNASTTVNETTKRLDNSLGDLQRQFIKVSSAEDVAEQDMQAFKNAAIRANLSAQQAEEGVNELTTSFFELTSATDLSDKQLNNLRNSVMQVGASSFGAQTGVDSINRAMLAMYGSAQAAEEAIENFDNEVEDTTRSSLGLAGALGVLSGAAEGTALEFGSLSVNIGPFNLALRNFLTQVPAILTGMGSMLAVVSSLIVAFTTLAAVSGALVVGGALAFFEEFSSQFEETGQAVEALGAALRDLFSEALEPLMTAGNIDLFTGFINTLARITNRFAQFAQIMRGDVLGAISQMEGDVDNFFNAMRKSFLLLEPVVIGIMNFFLNDLPPILERFATLTRNVSGDLDVMLTSTGELMAELLDFASVVLGGLAPAFEVILTLLTDVFILINAIPDALFTGAIAGGILSLALVKLGLSAAGAASSLISLNATMLAQIGTGSLLGQLYSTLVVATRGYAAGNVGLAGAISFVTTNMWAQIGAAWASTKAYVSNSLAASLLGSAKVSLAGAISTVMLALTNEAGVLTLSSVAMGVYSAVTSVAATVTTALSTAVWSLIGAVASISTPVLVVIGLIPILLGLLAQLAGFDVLGGIANFFKGIIGFIKDTIKWMKNLLGLGGSGNINGNMSVDDIQTQANMNLNFEESTENNVEVQADPEEKAQLSRVTKDAIEEANAFSRRRQGTQ